MRWPFEERAVREITPNYRVHFTRGRLHAEILTREALSAGAKLIVCVGGDSTLCEIANELLRSARLGHDVPALTLHPQLQRGDAIRSLALRESFKDFLTAFLRGEAREEYLDLGECEFTGDYGQKIRRRFVNAAGFGFSSLVVDRLSRDPWLSRSRFGFLRLVLRLAPFYRPPHVDIWVDGEKRFERTAMITGLIHNGKYGARGIKLSEKATFSDGKLEFTFFMRAFPLRYFTALGALLTGRLRPSSSVHQGSFKEMLVQPSHGHRRIPVDFDGDVWGYLPSRFRIVEKALKIVV